jgi:acyl carrier protein
MGLDGVELVMEIEKAFDIRIPDEEAEKILTVGDMYNSVWNHLENRHSNQCNSQILFYTLRKYFTDTFQLPKHLFKPHTLLNDIFPRENRRKQYFIMENNINLELPGLVLTDHWGVFLNSVGLICIPGGILFSIILKNFFNYSNWVFLIPLAGSATTLLTSKFLIPKRTVIRPSLVRDFTHKTLAMNYSTVTKKMGVNRKEVETVINQIIVDKIGVDLEEISPEKSFTDDLGVD